MSKNIFEIIDNINAGLADLRGALAPLAELAAMAGAGPVSASKRATGKKKAKPGPAGKKAGASSVMGALRVEPFLFFPKDKLIHIFIIFYVIHVHPFLYVGGELIKVTFIFLRNNFSNS